MTTFICTHGQTTNWWTWMSGNDTAYNYDGYVSPTNYGTMGTQAPTNNPGIRASQGGWLDAAGNFWFYGGQDIITGYFYSDLWKYSPGSGEWTWAGGSNLPNSGTVYGSAQGTPGGNPGARYGHSCSTDASGHFWLFGGLTPLYSNSTAGVYMNDLWTYDPIAGQWTLVSGNQEVKVPESGVYGTKGAAAANNLPGGREYASTWFDASGNLWLFGGEGYDGKNNIGALNDLWEYTGGQWVWISGSNQANNGGSYGTQGDTATSNMPPARWQQTTCADGAGHFWLFGGSDDAGNAYNDLWEYDPVAGLWTWVSGSNSLNQNGVYGTQGIPAVTNMPGGRFGHNMQIDLSGNILIFGGGDRPPTTWEGSLNDLWSYNLQQNTWTWVGGSQTYGSQGSFGQEGVPAPANLLPSRLNASSWLDASDNLWIFGGWTINPFSAGLDDVWEFAPATPLPVESVTLQGLAQGSDNLLIWQTIDEINTSTFVIERSPDGVRFSAIGTVAAIGSGNNNYSFTDTHVLVSVSYYYRIEMKDKDGKISYSQTILLQSAASSGLTVYPNPATSFVIEQLNDNSLLNTPLRLLDLNGRLITEQIITAQQQRIDLSQLSRGIYYLQFANGSTVKILLI
jgi:hypothetical protein